MVPSFSGPRVSDDNPFPEALFRTMKYRPSYPDRPFTDHRRCPALGRRVRGLVQRRPPAQRDPLRHAEPAPRREGDRHPRASPSRLPRGTGPPSWPVDPSHSQLVTCCDRPTQPRARRRHAEPLTCQAATLLTLTADAVLVDDDQAVIPHARSLLARCPVLGIERKRFRRPSARGWFRLPESRRKASLAARL